MITARLATGAALSGPDDVAALKAAGITHVIDERAEFDDGQLLAGSGLTYLWNPTADDGQPKPDAWWQANISFALQAYSVLGTCILAHCAAGVNRGPSAAYGIIRACWGFPVAQAAALVKVARPQAGIAYAADFERWQAARPTNPAVMTVQTGTVNG